MKRKLLSFLLSVAMMLGLCCAGVAAETGADLKYSVLSTTTAEISFYMGMDTTLKIPAKIDGYTIVGISDSAFFGSTLTGVTLPSTLQYVGEWAFNSCYDLKSITIPNKVTEIGDNAFEKCTSLKTVKIGNKVREIGEKAFSGCTALEKVTLGKSVAEIDEEAFYGCSALKSITIPNSVRKIDDKAFADCTSLKTAKIGKGVKDIGDLAFCDTQHLEYFDNPTADELEKLWEQNVICDKISIHAANNYAQKHFKKLKYNYSVYHQAVAKNAKPTVSLTTKGGSITVKFSKVKSAKKYTVVLGGAASRTYTARGTSYTIKGLSSGKTYSVKLRASIKGGKYSKTVKIKVK